jgi:cysteinyl-tRNA synthetase
MEGTMTTAESLKQIADRLLTIETQLAARGILIDVTQAIDDNLNTFGLIAQLVEIHKAQSEARQKQADAILDRLTAIEAGLAGLAQGEAQQNPAE